MARPKPTDPSPSPLQSAPDSAPSNPPPHPPTLSTTPRHLPPDLARQIIDRARVLSIETFANMGGGILIELGYLNPSRYLNIRDLGIAIRSSILLTPTSLTPWAANLAAYLNTHFGHWDPPTLIDLLSRYACARHLLSVTAPTLLLDEATAPVNPEEGD